MGRPAARHSKGAIGVPKLQFPSGPITAKEVFAKAFRLDKRHVSLTVREADLVIKMIDGEELTPQEQAYAEDTLRPKLASEYGEQFCDEGACSL